MKQTWGKRNESGEGRKRQIKRGEDEEKERMNNMEIARELAACLQSVSLH